MEESDKLIVVAETGWVHFYFNAEAPTPDGMKKDHKFMFSQISGWGNAAHAMCTHDFPVFPGDNFMVRLHSGETYIYQDVLVKAVHAMPSDLTGQIENWLRDKIKMEGMGD